MSISAACRIFKISRNTYYSWKKRIALSEGASRRAREDAAIRLLILKLIERNTYVPGKRGMRDLLFKHYGIRPSVERVAHLMKEMNIEASSSRRKDAYKGMMMNIHPCCALQNHVRQDFYIGCRCIILTDITYIPYGLKEHVYAYLCTFKDPCTCEILGYAVSGGMDTGLVREAWDMMMENHGDEFPKDRQIYVHSDQGTQYLSAEYKELVSGSFIQSMSRRGNSLDNAPQESFFGRMKSRLSNHFPLMTSVDQVRTMIDRYMKDYNQEIPQTTLGGLTPALYYQYRMTGVYPKTEYFGIPAGQLNGLEDVIASMQKRAKKRSAKQKESRERRSVNPDRQDPVSIVTRDLDRLKKRLETVTKQLSKLNELADKIRELIEQAEEALRYLNGCGEEQLRELETCSGWDLIPQLSYVKNYSLVFD